MLTVEYVKNPRWSCPEKSQLLCVVKFQEFEQELPFRCIPEDIYQHSKDIWERCTSGEFGEIADFKEILAPEEWHPMGQDVNAQPVVQDVNAQPVVQGTQNF